MILKNKNKLYEEFVKSALISSQKEEIVIF